jgi:hypothetical protein
MAMDIASQSESSQSLLKIGDELERETWEELRNYIGLYETIWRLFSLPLRVENSISFRDGIDPDLEILAMCNYTAYVNVARALKKIKAMEDDLKFSEEIWANLQRAVEVGKKAAGAFKKVYVSSTGKNPKLDRRQLESAELQIRKYRNRLHETVPAMIKDTAKTRLLPKRELLSQYELWTKVMYHARRDDFVTVEGQLSKRSSDDLPSLAERLGADEESRSEFAGHSEVSEQTLRQCAESLTKRNASEPHGSFGNHR